MAFNSQAHGQSHRLTAKKYGVTNFDERRSYAPVKHLQPPTAGESNQWGNQSIKDSFSWRYTWMWRSFFQQKISRRHNNDLCWMCVCGFAFPEKMIGLVKLTFAYQTRWYNYSHELRMQGRNSINSNPPPEGLTLKQVNLKVVSWVKGASCPRGSCCDGEEKIGGIDLNEMIRLTARLKRSPHPGEWHKKMIISLVIPAAVKRLNPIRPPSWRRWGKSQSAGRGGWDQTKGQPRFWAF